MIGYVIIFVAAFFLGFTVCNLTRTISGNLYIVEQEGEEKPYIFMELFDKHSEDVMTKSSTATLSIRRSAKKT